MADIVADIRKREFESLCQLKAWIEIALSDESLLTDDAFGHLIAYALDNSFLSAEEMVVVAAASKSQISRWRNNEALPSDRHKKQGVMRDLLSEISKQIQQRAPRKKRKPRSKPAK